MGRDAEMKGGTKVIIVNNNNDNNNNILKECFKLTEVYPTFKFYIIF